MLLVPQTLSVSLSVSPELKFNSPARGKKKQQIKTGLLTHRSQKVGEGFLLIPRAGSVGCSYQLEPSVFFSILSNFLTYTRFDSATQITRAVSQLRLIDTYGSTTSVFNSKTNIKVIHRWCIRKSWPKSETPNSSSCLHQILISSKYSICLFPCNLISQQYRDEISSCSTYSLHI